MISKKEEGDKALEIKSSTDIIQTKQIKTSNNLTLNKVKENNEKKEKEKRDAEIKEKIKEKEKCVDKEAFCSFKSWCLTAFKLQTQLIQVTSTPGFSHNHSSHSHRKR